MISLSRDLGVLVTAEGVETAAQLRDLRNLGCDCVQGYLISPPMSASEVAGFIDDWCEEVHDALFRGKQPRVALKKAA